MVGGKTRSPTAKANKEVWKFNLNKQVNTKIWLVEKNQVFIESFYKNSRKYSKTWLPLMLLLETVLATKFVYCWEDRVSSVLKSIVL